jgi:hypothetical protein
MTDRYARLHHGYNDEMDCQEYAQNDKPEACLLGSADAQNAVAISSLISNIFTFFTSSLVGSLSDEHGRKGMQDGINDIPVESIGVCYKLIQLILTFSHSPTFALSSQVY